MRKYLVSGALACVLGVTGLHAAEGNNGGFAGLHVGGLISGNLGNSVALNSSVAVGLKGGYQAYFFDNFGARFYLSGIAAFGLLSVNQGTGGTTNGMNVNLSVMGDLNADLLFDFINDDDFSTGMYAGFFGGALVTTSVYVPQGMPRNPNTVATTAGINIGSRTTIRTHHEFDIGAKIGLAFNLEGTTSTLGAAIYVGSSYSYKF